MTNDLITSRLHKNFVLLLFWCNILLLAIRHTRNFMQAIHVVNKLEKTRQSYQGSPAINKLVMANGKYMWDMHGPRWPSKAFNEHMTSEINRMLPDDSTITLRNAVVALTKKCPLQCEHCYEGDNINGREVLKYQDLRKIIHKLQDHGVMQIQFAGGEPMMRYHEMVRLLIDSPGETDFWMITSGLNLSLEKAKTLKAAGLNGVCVSLDHFDAIAHDNFRHYKGSFNQVSKAVKNAKKAGLVIALSLCATKEFVTSENIWKYLDLASRWKVPFVQILEPRAVGSYLGQEISLSIEQKKLLQEVFQKVNSSSKYLNYPILVYHDHYLEPFGCFGAGDRFLYVDTDGDVNPCPVCRNKIGNCISADLDQLLSDVRKAGCGLHQRAMG